MRSEMLLRPSSRILDIPCKVCRDNSSGKHYGIFACDGCAGFFKRSIRKGRHYVCKAKAEGTCMVDKSHRNQCRACRLNKCLEAGMNREAVQHERGPRNATLRRQMGLYYKGPGSPAGPVLDLAVPKSSPKLEPSMHTMVPPTFICNPVTMPRMPLLPSVPPPPPPISAVWNLEMLCEHAASLLFMNVRWARSVRAFTSLPTVDQLLLIEESWRELFVLAAAQFLAPLELTPLVHASGLLVRDPAKASAFLHEVKIFQETLYKFSQMRVNANEFACLRAILLFKTSFDSPGNASPAQTTSKTLSEPSIVSSLQDQTQLALNRYISTAFPDQPMRFGKLLLLLPALKTVSNNTIVELFFRSTIGDTPIELILCNVYNSEKDIQ